MYTYTENEKLAWNTYARYWCSLHRCVYDDICFGMRKDNAAISAGIGEANDVLKFLEMGVYVSHVNMPGGSKEWNKHVPNLLCLPELAKYQ